MGCNMVEDEKRAHSKSDLSESKKSQKHRPRSPDNQSRAIEGVEVEIRCEHSLTTSREEERWRSVGTRRRGFTGTPKTSQPYRALRWQYPRPLHIETLKSKEAVQYIH